MTEINPMLERVKVDSCKLHITLGVFNLESPARYEQILLVFVSSVNGIETQ